MTEPPRDQEFQCWMKVNAEICSCGQPRETCLKPCPAKTPSSSLTSSGFSIEDSTHWSDVEFYDRCKHSEILAKIRIPFPIMADILRFYFPVKELGKLGTEGEYPLSETLFCDMWQKILTSEPAFREVRDWVYHVYERMAKKLPSPCHFAPPFNGVAVRNRVESPQLLIEFRFPSHLDCLVNMRSFYNNRQYSFHFNPNHITSTCCVTRLTAYHKDAGLFSYIYPRYVIYRGHTTKHVETEAIAQWMMD